MKKNIFFFAFIFTILLFNCTNRIYDDLNFEQVDFTDGWDEYNRFRFLAARDSFKNYIRNYRPGYNTVEKLKSNFNGLGWSYLHLNNWTECISSFDSLLKMDSTYNDARLGKILALYYSENYANISTELDSLLSIDNNYTILPIHKDIDNNVGVKEAKKVTAFSYFAKGDFYKALLLVDPNNLSNLPTNNELYTYSDIDSLLSIIQSLKFLGR